MLHEPLDLVSVCSVHEVPLAVYYGTIYCPACIEPDYGCDCEGDGCDSADCEA